MDTSERTLVGVVAPYDQTTYLVADPGGERISRGAFSQERSARRADKVPLHDNHGTQRRMGDLQVVRGRRRRLGRAPS